LRAADVVETAPATSLHRAPERRTFESFDELTSCCPALLEAAGHGGLFASLPWYSNFVAHALDAGDRVRLFTVGAERPAGPHAMLPMRWSERARSWQAPKRLEGLANYYSSLFGPSFAEGHRETAVVESLVEGISNDPLRWDVVDLHPLAVDHDVFPAFLAAFRKSGFVATPYFCFGNWYLEVKGRSSDAYFAGLPSQLRNTIKRKRARLQKAHGLRIVVYRDESVEEGVRAYEQVYRSSWKRPEPYPDFIPGLCRACAAAGWLRLGVAYVDDKPAAAQIWITRDGTAHIFKLAYDEQFQQHSAGSILTAHLMQQAIDVDRVDTVDYLTGDDAYKKDWMTARRERWGIVACNLRTPRGFVLGAREVLIARAKSALGRIGSRGQRREPSARSGADPVHPSNHAWAAGAEGHEGRAGADEREAVTD
jgi:hypothetical protein